MLTLYDFHESGNGYKVRLLLHQLGLPFERRELDILAGATRTPGFLALNPNGRIPVLVLDDGSALAESNAILFYLADGTALLPSHRLARARVLQWLFFEQYSHEPYIAVLRFWTFSGQLEAHRHELADRRAKGEAALEVMEAHLRDRDFFVADRYTVADIALYAYTHVAGEGGFDLTGHPHVQRWLARVASQPRHIPIAQLEF